MSTTNLTKFSQDWTENKKFFIIGQKVVRTPFLKNAASSWEKVRYYYKVYVEEFSRELQHIVTRYGSACFTSNTIASPYQNGLVVFHALQT